MGEGYHPTGKELEARLYHSEKESDSREKNGRKCNGADSRPLSAWIVPAYPSYFLKEMMLMLILVTE